MAARDTSGGGTAMGWPLRRPRPSHFRHERGTTRAVLLGTLTARRRFRGPRHTRASASKAAYASDAEPRAAWRGRSAARRPRSRPVLACDLVADLLERASDQARHVHLRDPD